MESMKDRIKRLYEEEKVTESMIEKYVLLGLITEEEKEWIENSQKNSLNE